MSLQKHRSHRAIGYSFPARNPNGKEPSESEQTAKLSVIQYWDRNQYVRELNNRPSFSNPVEVGASEYAILIKVSDVKSFLYKPMGTRGDSCIAEYAITTPQETDSLLAGSVGDRDIKSGKADGVHAVIEMTELQSGISTCDWVLKILRLCERAEYLDGQPSFP